MSSFLSGGFSHIGRRTRNEDAMLLLPEHGLFAIADGMGGLHNGELAADMAIETVARGAPKLAPLRERLEQRPHPDDKLAVFDLLGSLFEEATLRIHSFAEGRGAPMGCTLTVGVVSGNEMLVAHVGDSRLYTIRGGVARLLTEDHSVAALRLRRGRMTPEEYATSGLRHTLYQSIGTQAEVEPDFLEVDLETGDTLLLCSDGVWDHLSELRIGQLTAASRVPADLARALVGAAYDSDSTDNLTAVVVRFQHGAGRAPINLDHVLSNTPLFSWLGSSERRRIAPFLKTLELTDGEDVFLEGEEGEDLYVVAEGEVRIHAKGVELVRLKPGQHFGEIAMALRSPRTATVTAVGPVRLLSLHREHLNALIKRSPILGARMMDEILHAMAQRMVDLTQQLAARKGKEG